MFSNVTGAKNQIIFFHEKLTGIATASRDKSKSILDLSQELNKIKQDIQIFRQQLDKYKEDETYKDVQNLFNFLNKNLFSIEQGLLSIELKYAIAGKLKETKAKPEDEEIKQDFLILSKLEKSIELPNKDIQATLVSFQREFKKLKTSIPNLAQIIAREDAENVKKLREKEAEALNKQQEATASDTTKQTPSQENANKNIAEENTGNLKKAAEEKDNNVRDGIMFTNVEEANKQIENIKEKLEAIHKASRDKSESIIKLSNDLKQIKENMVIFGKQLDSSGKTYEAIQNPLELLNQKLLSVETALLVTELKYTDIAALKTLNNKSGGKPIESEYSNLLAVQAQVELLNKNIEERIRKNFSSAKEKLASLKSGFEKLKTSIPNLANMIAEKDVSERNARREEEAEQREGVEYVEKLREKEAKEAEEALKKQQKEEASAIKKKQQQASKEPFPVIPSIASALKPAVIEGLADLEALILKKNPEESARKAAEESAKKTARIQTSPQDIRKLQQEIANVILLIQNKKERLPSQEQYVGELRAISAELMTIGDEKNKVLGNMTQEQYSEKLGKCVEKFETFKIFASGLFPELDSTKIAPEAVSYRNSVQKSQLKSHIQGYIFETEKKLKKTWPGTTERKFFEECVRRGKDLMQETDEGQNTVEVIKQKFEDIRNLNTRDGLKKDFDNKIKVFTTLLNGELKNNQDQFSPEQLAMKKKCTEYQGKVLKLKGKIDTAGALKNTKLKECILEISDMEREFSKSSASIKKRSRYDKL